MAGLLIVGAGGHGKVVADTAVEMGKWENVAFVDDRYLQLKTVLTRPVIGNILQTPLFLAEYSDIIVAIGSNSLRFELLRRFRNMGFYLPTLVHPTAFISRSATIGAGSVVFAQVAVNAGTQLGMGSIVNTGATIDHDCVVGDGVHISPGAHLAGEVQIGNCSWIGIGSSILQQISIGENVIVGAGAAITVNIPRDVTVVGVPGKIIKGL
jgi:sugar O-acyltransferase (sialic acid O-acetyltransferase NeuD family)